MPSFRFNYGSPHSPFSRPPSRGNYPGTYSRGSSFPTFSPSGSRPPVSGNYPGTYPRTVTSLAAALPPYPTQPTASQIAGLPTGSSTGTPSAGLPPDFTALIGNLLSGLSGSSGGIDPLTGIPLAQRALIQYGEVPDQNSFGGVQLSQLGGAFNDSTRKLAQENTASGISLTARLAQADADRRRYITNSLAAHGILDSGETGFQTAREQTDYSRARADSLGKLLDYLSGINSGIAGYLQQQAMMKALMDLLAGGGDSGDSGGGGGGVPDWGGQPPPGWEGLPPNWFEPPLPQTPPGLLGPGSYKTPGGHTAV